jgi:hypothetical protein
MLSDIIKQIQNAKEIIKDDSFEYLSNLDQNLKQTKIY